MQELRHVGLTFHLAMANYLLFYITHANISNLHFIYVAHFSCLLRLGRHHRFIDMWNQPQSPRSGSINNQNVVGMSSKLFAPGKNIFCVGEELKIASNIALERFRLTEDQQELDFPSSLTSNERAYIHKLCANYGFKSRSKGKGTNRYLTVMKKDSAWQSCALSNVHLVRNSRHQIQNLLQKNPVTSKERQELQLRVERNQINESIMKEIAKTTTGRLNNGVAQVPPQCSPSYEFSPFQETLPVNMMKDVIIKTINDNKVTLIVGETGSGKTTQIPQIILNDCQASNRPCRIFCTQPRRLSALTVAERVAAERGEKIGQTVGYQIRLESRVSPKTILTFCTNGVLLRTLIAGDQTISYVTHVIVDEIHERDRFCDFLLIVLKELLPKMKHLRLILMSACMNTQLFISYFTGCSVLHVPGRLFDVQDFFLEDILKWTNYSNKEMEKKKHASGKGEKTKIGLDEWCRKSLITKMESGMSGEGGCMERSGDIIHNSGGSIFSKADARIGPEKEELEPWLIKELDNLLSEIWLNGKEESFSQIFHLILNENVSVDYRHSEMSVTSLMVASGRGFIGVVEKLLNMGANVYARSSNDWKAIDWAQKFDQTEVVELLEAHMAAMENGEDDETYLLKNSETLSQEDKDMLNLYHSTFDDDKVDIDLIVCLLIKIHSLPQQGAILVFLPGYDEIMMLRERILEQKNFSENSRFILYTLHSQMQSSDQKNIFKIPETGTRKIILSTNIAETSITVNDVVFVIDSGKVKVKSYDALTSVSMLKSQWVSKSSVSQRAGRAGRCRPGVAYHLFSSIRYQNMTEFHAPEILCYPLQELCLHTKLLASPNCKIGDFLSKAPEPPASLVVKNAVHLLKQIDALDSFEDLTELGHHLADLPVEPRYGKMILYSVVLKCLDPILTIACSLAYKDPFLLPSQPYQKRAAAMSRRRFAAGTFSDHMALLRAFQGWQKARIEGWEKSFCDKNFLSSSTMEMIVAMRTQLLGQLRAAGFVRARGGGDIRDLNSNSENWSVVKAALCAGMYPNLIKVDRDRCCLMTNKESKIHFHSSSVLGLAPNEVSFNGHNTAIGHLPTDWLAFEEMTRMHRTIQVRSCTAISPVTVALFAGPARLSADVIHEAENSLGSLKMDSGNEAWNSDSEEDEVQDDAQPKCFLKLDDWIKFSFEPSVSSLVIQLRLKWHSLFMRRMRTPTKLWSQYDESTVRTIVGVLTNEEQALGLQQPSGIGQRPRPMCNETSVLSGGFKDSPICNYESITCLEKKKEDCIGIDIEEKFSSIKLNQSDKSNSQTFFSNLSSSDVKLPHYFLVKTSNPRLLSEIKKCWPAVGNIEYVSRLLKEGNTVYFIFTLHGSGHFQGYAKVTDLVANHVNREMPNYYYSIDWIKRGSIPFYQCQAIMATLFDKKVLSSSDVQELESCPGEQLLKLWDKVTVNQSFYQNTMFPEQDSIWSSVPKQSNSQQPFSGHPFCNAYHSDGAGSQLYGQSYFHPTGLTLSHNNPYSDRSEK